MEYPHASRSMLSMLTCDKAASIGNLNESFIKSLYLAAQGMEGPHLYEMQHVLDSSSPTSTGRGSIS
jgi:hypothetical protein